MNIFNSEDLDYLNGKIFHNSKKFKIGNPKNIPRLNFLESLSEGKKILHIGFADHVELIEDKVSIGRWLHKRLVDKADICVGIDISHEAINFVEKKYNLKNLYKLDVTNDEIPVVLTQTQWDYMILGELLEHVDNPVEFLTKIRDKYSPFVDKLVVTVPNALNLNNIKSAFRNEEQINTDHRYWFTPITLAKVIMRAGYKIDSYTMSQMFFPARRRLFSFLSKKFIINRFPLSRDTIIMISDFNSND